MQESVEECLRDYPMEIITGVIYFFIKIVTDYNYSISDRPDLSETQVFFPVVFAVTYALNTWVRRKIAAAYYAVPLLMIALFALFYKELHGFIDSMGFGCTLIAVVMLFFACAKNGGNRAFSAETLSKAEDLALSVFTGMLFTGVMSAIYGSVEYLFGVVINAYGKTLFFSLYIVMPVLFLTMHGKSSSGPGKFVKVMLNYILHPAILIYAAILYLYAAKIAVEWTLPEGGVAYMVSAFVIASLAGQMLQLVDAKKIYGWYYRNFLWIAIVPLALFWTGVAYRVNAYGFTEARVYLVVFGALMTLFVLMRLVRRIYVYQWMLLVAVAAVAIFTYIPGISADDIGLRSQINRVRSLASELGLLGKDGMLTGTAQFSPKDEAQRQKALEICEAYDYVYYNISDERISDYAGRSDMVERVLGKNELDSSKLDVNKTFIYLQLPDNLPLPVEGYSRAYFDGCIGGDIIRFGNGGKIPLPGKAYFARYADLCEKMADSRDGDDSRQSVEPFIFRNDTCMVVFDRLCGFTEDGSWAVASGSSCYVFVK